MTSVPPGRGDHDADRFGYDDAAYLLGLLPDDQRAAFTEHIAGCAECAARVAALTPAADALARLEPADWAALSEPVPPAPDTLLPQTIRAARRHRTRLRAALAAAGTAAAATIAALIVALSTSGPASVGGPAAGRAMTPVTSTPVRATVALAATGWGTRISVDCRYTTAQPYPTGSKVYQLQVLDTSGHRLDLGSWTQSGRDVRFTGGIALAESRIRAVQVALPSGTPILTLSIR